MTTLATQLRNAVLAVLMDNGGPLNMSDDDYVFLNFVSTYGQGREGGVPMGSVVAKTAADVGGQQRTYTDTGTARIGDAPAETDGTTLDTRAPDGQTAPAGAGALPDSTEVQEALPLGSIDRGPEPQDITETLDTREPAFDATDPPPDYRSLAGVKGDTAG